VNQTDRRAANPASTGPDTVGLMNESSARQRRRPRRLGKSELAKAIYIDFEKRAIEEEPPVMLGVLLHDSPGLSGSWTFTQYVFDPGLWPLADATGPPAVRAELRETLNALVERSDAEARPLVGWSFHDRDLIRQWSDHGPVRYRNAIRTARRWRQGRTSIDGGPDVEFEHNDLQSYLRLIGYDVPGDVRRGAGRWIANVRERLASGSGTVADMSRSGRRDWDRLLAHNRHDCLGMRAVMYRVHGMEPPTPPVVSS
jgi:hypothetical protein